MDTRPAATDEVASGLTINDLDWAATFVFQEYPDDVWYRLNGGMVELCDGVLVRDDATSWKEYADMPVVLVTGYFQRT